MSTYCPPMPHYARSLGITDCDYLQLDPYVKEQMRLQHQNTNSLKPTNSVYTLGDYPMNHSPVLFGYPNHMGRPLLISQAKNFSRLRSDNQAYSKEVPGFRYTGSGAAFSDNNIRDIWSGQVLALWISNGRVFEQYKMNGIVTENGHSPTNLAPLKMKSNGQVTEDLSVLLKKMPRGATARYVMGPDGVFGNAMDDILSEVARTGKVFGFSIPAAANKVFDRLLSKYTSNAIQAAKAQAQRGQTVPSNDLPETPANMLHGEAQVAAGLKQTRPSHGDALITPPSTPTVQPAIPPQQGKTTVTEDKEEENNTLLYAGLAGGLLLIAGVGYYYYEKNK